MQVLQNCPDELWKLATANITLHSVCTQIPELHLTIKTYSHKPAQMYSPVTSHAVLYCMKRSLRKCRLTLRHIGNTPTNDGFFKLVEALLLTNSCFFSQCINVRGLPLSACHCLAALPAKTSAFNSHMQQNARHRNIKWIFADLLPCNCYAIKTNNRTIHSRLSQPTSAGKGGTWVNCSSSLHDTITVNLALVQCKFHTGKKTVFARVKSINRN